LKVNDLPIDVTGRAYQVTSAACPAFVIKLHWRLVKVTMMQKSANLNFQCQIVKEMLYISLFHLLIPIGHFYALLAAISIH
jgi:hypothetical protein